MGDSTEEVQKIYDTRGYVDYTNFNIDRLVVEAPIKKALPDSADVVGSYWEMNLKYDYDTKNGPVNGVFCIQLPTAWSSGVKLTEKNGQIIGEKINPYFEKDIPEHAKCILVLHSIYMKVLKFLHTPENRREIVILSTFEEIENWSRYEKETWRSWAGIKSLLFYGLPADPNAKPITVTTVFGSKPLRTQKQIEKMTGKKAKFAKKYKVCKNCPPTNNCMNKKHPRVASYLSDKDLQKFMLQIQALVSISSVVISGTSKMFRTTTMSAVVHNIKERQDSFKQEDALNISDMNTSDISDMENLIRTANLMQDENRNTEDVVEDSNVVTNEDITEDSPVETF